MTRELSSRNNESPPFFQERPRICLIDVDRNASALLVANSFNCTNGSFGSQVRIPNKESGQRFRCLLNYTTPANLHEYDVIVIDLKDREPIDYVANQHQQANVKTPNDYFFICKYPQTVFDPRPYAASIVADAINEFQKKESIILVFANGQDICTYTIGELTTFGLRELDEKTINNYSFLPSIPVRSNKVGHETRVITGGDEEFRGFLQKYINQFHYEVTFSYATRWDKEQRTTVRDEHFIPFMVNSADEVISFAFIENGSILLVFPQLEDKSGFLLELFRTQLPTILPTLFPYSTEFAWIKNDAYRLPNEAQLLSAKEDLKQEYEIRLSAIEQDINRNHQDYQFLHDLLTETGARLVKAVERYLHWLEFEEVTNCDEAFPGRNEEDLQVNLTNELLVIEVKGIAGTSKDEECSQIEKIKHRREKERGAFDVFGLYIVNHQRHQPPLNRSNPPFTEKQVQDSENDERGLLTTYDLFKLYYAIEAGFITKEDARQSLLRPGLVTFNPSNAILIGEPIEIHYGGLVGIFLLNETPLKVGEGLIADEHEVYRPIIIESLRDDDKDISEISHGEIGIKFFERIHKHTRLWKRIQA